MHCKNCGAPMQENQLHCPYCGFENEALALGQHLGGLRQRQEKASRIRQMPGRAEARTGSVLRRLGKVLFVLFLAALAAAVAARFVLPRLQLRRQQQTIMQLEQLYAAGDYAGLAEQLEQLPESYDAVYRKYDTAASLYARYAYLRDTLPDVVELQRQVEDTSLLESMLDDLFLLLARFDELRANGFVYGEQQAVDALEAETAALGKSLLELTDEAIAAGRAVCLQESPNYDPILELVLEQISEAAA